MVRESSISTTKRYLPTTLTWVFSFPILMCFFKSQKVSKKEKRDEQKKNGEPSTHQGRGSHQRWMYAHHTSWLRRPVRGWKVDICAHCQRHSLRGQRVKIQRGGWWWKERESRVSQMQRIGYETALFQIRWYFKGPTVESSLIN